MVVDETMRSSSLNYSCKCLPIRYMIYFLIGAARRRMVRRLEEEKYNASSDHVDHMIAGDHSRKWTYFQRKRDEYFITCAVDDITEATSLPNAVWGVKCDGDLFDFPFLDMEVDHPDSDCRVLMSLKGCSIIAAE